jgi:hypothetical protein
MASDHRAERGRERLAQRPGRLRAQLQLTGGGRLREQLLAFSDLERSFTYNILESPLPVENYVATFRCKPVTEGNKTFVEWIAEFDVAPQDEAAIKEQVGRNTFAAGIEALAKKLGG